MSGRSLSYDVHIVKKKSGPFGCRVLGFHRRNYDISVIFLRVRSKKNYTVKYWLYFISYSMFTSFGPTFFPWAGVGKYMYFAFPAWYLDYGKYIFLPYQFFWIIHTSTYFRSYQQYNPFLIRNVEKQIIVIEISLFWCLLHMYRRFS